ncbi:hypothetical protein B7494_g7872 [Chlorociboria aeruginascens]|nr:hypothetical protein B7494_g7872 [Chlorociboria aeruginascens]
MDSSPAIPRRSPRSQNIASTSTPSTSQSPNGSPSKTKIMARRSPYIPTTLETAILAIYPATLIIGSIFALLDPSTRASPYNAATQSHHESTAPSYFAKKSNVFNQVFVKRGWAWVTGSFFFFLFTHPSTGPPRSLILTPRRLRATLRWVIITAWWIFVTQWFFGPAIIDRGFLITGGQCELVEDAREGKVDMDDTRQFLSHVACKAVGGKWKGGHDISGHVFLLVLGSMFLLEEVVHVILRSKMVPEERTIYTSDGAIKSAEVEAEDGTTEGYGQFDLGIKIALGVSGLSIFMLSMTAIYFHTWFEKLTGLLVAYSGIFVAYLLPRFIPSMRRVVGMPGV